MQIIAEDGSSFVDSTNDDKTMNRASLFLLNLFREDLVVRTASAFDFSLFSIFLYQFVTSASGMSDFAS